NRSTFLLQIRYTSSRGARPASRKPIHHTRLPRRLPACGSPCVVAGMTLQVETSDDSENAFAQANHDGAKLRYAHRIRRFEEKHFLGDRWISLRRINDWFVKRPHDF